MVCVYPKDILDMPRVPTNAQSPHHSMTHVVELSTVYNPQITLTPHFSRITLARYQSSTSLSVLVPRPLLTFYFGLLRETMCLRPPAYLYHKPQGALQVCPIEQAYCHFLIAHNYQVHPLT